MPSDQGRVGLQVLRDLPTVVGERTSFLNDQPTLILSPLPGKPARSDGNASAEPDAHAPPRGAYACGGPHGHQG